MKKHVKFLLFWVPMLLMLSCSDVIEDEDFRTAGEAFGIRHDRNLSEYEKIATNVAPYTIGNYPDFEPVVNFIYSLDGSDNQDIVASGVLISNEWILTAGHNFFVSDEQSEPAPVEGISVHVGSDPNVTSLIYNVDTIVFHPTWLNEDEDYVKANDLCLVKISESINNITPAPVNYSKTEVIGSTVWYAGFGDYSQSEGQNPDLFSNKHAYENVLDRVADGISSGNGSHIGGLLAFDFDDPDGIINALGDDLVNEDEALLGDGNSDAVATDFEATTVEGDSGGPLFIFIDGEWKVCGILSGGANEPIDNHRDSDYGDISIFIRTANQQNWIESVIN